MLVSPCWGGARGSSGDQLGLERSRTGTVPTSLSGPLKTLPQLWATAFEPLLMPQLCGEPALGQGYALV